MYRIFSYKNIGLWSKLWFKALQAVEETHYNVRLTKPLLHLFTKTAPMGHCGRVCVAILIAISHRS